MYQDGKLFFHTALGGTLDHFRVFGSLGAQEMGLWQNTCPAKVKTVGIPAGLNREIGFGQAVGMIRTSVVQQFEIGVV